jgi:hypothetical protein
MAFRQKQKIKPNMKKFIIACGIIAGFTFISESASAQTGTLKGTTKQVTNSSGGVSTQCPPSTNTCTTYTQNADGTRTLTIFKYDIHGNPDGTVVYQIKSGDAGREPDIEAGYVNDVETSIGILWGREI